MAARYPGWLTIGRILALVALVLVILTVVPGTPEWLLAVAVGVLAVGILVG